MTVRCQTDSLVEIEYSRLRDWAAKRLVSDTLRRELASDFAQQGVTVLRLERAQALSDTVIARQAREIGKWKDLNAGKDQQIQLLEKKRARARTWRWVERVGLLGVGIYIGTKL